MNQKILFKFVEEGKLRLTIIGGVLGLSILIIGLHLFLDIKEILYKKVKINEDFLVLNKRIGLLNSVTQKPNTFNSEEIKEFSSVSGVEKIAAFEPSRFKVMMVFNPNSSQFKDVDFKTLLFFESIPKEFIDLEDTKWDWKEGETVPILMSSEYMKLYNLAFAGTQDLPLISEGILKSIQFDLHLKGPDEKSVVVKGQLVGFSDRINSILVPSEFLHWGNDRFANKSMSEPTRIVVKASNIGSAKLREFINDKGYQINEEKFKVGKSNAILKSVFSITALVAAIVILLAFLGFVQYNQLLTVQSAYEIKTLNALGHTARVIFEPYKRFTIRSITIMSGGALLLFLAEVFLSPLFLNFEGYQVQWLHVFVSLIIGVLTVFVMAYFILRNSKNQITKIIQ